MKGMVSISMKQPKFLVAGQSDGTSTTPTRPLPPPLPTPSPTPATKISEKIHEIENNLVTDGGAPGVPRSYTSAI